MDKGGFDVVIGNPPYIRQEQLSQFKPLWQKDFECYDGVADIYVYFFERGLQLLAEGGFLAYISPNKYFRSGYGKKLREYLSTKTTIEQIIDFGDAPVFDAITYPSIIVLRKLPPVKNQTRIFTWNPSEQLEKFSVVVASKTSTISQQELTADGWYLESKTTLGLLEKLRKAGKPLGEYVDGKFYRGIITGFNEAFVVDRATRDFLIGQHSSSSKLLKPLLRGKDVKRWGVSFAEQYLIKIESSENFSHPWSGKTDVEGEKIFSTTYPAIYKWLKAYQKELIKRDDQGKYFWELRSCKYWHEFEQPKIAYPNICKRNDFAWDDKGYYTNQKAFIIPNASMYLLGILNSSVVTWLFEKCLPKLQNGYFEPNAVLMKDFPIPVTTSPETIEELVNKILVTKSKDSKADVTKLEHQIDQLVYQLYDLTSEEIELVEGKV